MRKQWKALSYNSETATIEVPMIGCDCMQDTAFSDHPDPDIRRAKPLLSIEEQIEHLKGRGVVFELCGEEGAARYLADRTYLFKISAYRELFERRVGGARDGEYVGLDFAYLQELASADRTLRYTLLPLTLDVEHFARTKLMREVTAREDEDGYSIISDYLASLNHNERRRREGEIRALAPDAYCGDLVSKYKLPDQMPIWVFLELVSFGTFIDLYLFCANRWDDQTMRLEHYMLRQVKACRNACAHSSDMINGFARTDGVLGPSALVSEALAEAGISKRVRQSKMRNPRLQQIATLFYLHTRIVPEGTSKARAREDAKRLRNVMAVALKDLAGNDAVRSSFDFLITLLDSWF